MERTHNVKQTEHALGFEMKFLLPEGLPSENVQMIQTKNSRRTTEIIEERIRRYWWKKKQPNMFDGDRPRFEGIHYKKRSRELKIFCSHEKYRTHFYTGNTILPRSHQAQPFTINGIVIAKDNVIPIGLRKAERIWEIVPAGYVDMKPVVSKTTRIEAGLLNHWYIETPHIAAARELHEELAIPEGDFSASKMRLVGIVFNYSRYYDTTASIMIPVECDSSEIELRGDEHERLRFVKTSLNYLKEELVELSQDQNTSSGHLRGDIALTIAHLHGYSEYIKTLKNVFVEISGRGF